MNDNSRVLIIIIVIAMMAVFLTQTDSGNKLLNSKASEVNTSFEMIEDFADGKEVHLYKNKIPESTDNYKVSTP